MKRHLLRAALPTAAVAAATAIGASAVAPTVASAHDACAFPGYSWQGLAPKQAYIPTNGPLYGSVEPMGTFTTSFTGTKTTSTTYTIAAQLGETGGLNIPEIGLQIGGSASQTKTVAYATTTSLTYTLGSTSPNPLKTDAYPLVFVEGYAFKANLFYCKNDPKNLNKPDIKKVRSRTVYLPLAHPAKTQAVVGWVDSKITKPHAVTDKWGHPPANF